MEPNMSGEEIDIDFLALNSSGKKSIRYNNGLKDIDWFNKFKLNEKSILTKERFLRVENYINKFVSFKYENILNFMKTEFTLTELQHAFINLGIKIPGGSDCPIETGNPIFEFYAAVTRKEKF